MESVIDRKVLLVLQSLQHQRSTGGKSGLPEAAAEPDTQFDVDTRNRTEERISGQFRFHRADLRAIEVKREEVQPGA
jgi:hypothetical protein